MSSFVATLSWLWSDLLPDAVDTLLYSLTVLISLVSLVTKTVLDFYAGVVELSTSLYLKTFELVAILTSFVSRTSTFVSSTASTTWTWVLSSFSAVSSALLTVYTVIYDTLSVLLPFLALGLEAIVRVAALLLRGGATLFYSTLDFVVFFAHIFFSLVSTVLSSLSAFLSLFYSSGEEKQETNFNPDSPQVLSLWNTYYAVLVLASILLLALLTFNCFEHRDFVIRAWRLVKHSVTRGLQLLARDDNIERRPHHQQQQGGGDEVDLGQRGAARRVGEQDRNGDGGLQLGLDQQQSGDAPRNLHQRRGVLLNAGDNTRQTVRQTLGLGQSQELTPISPQQEGPPSPSLLSAREREGEQSRLCIVCMDEEKKVLLRPCRHYCVCEGCKLRLRGECPVCREAIQSSEVIHVYYD